MTSKESGMPAHKHSLGRAFAVHRHVVGTLRKLKAKRCMFVALIGDHACTFEEHKPENNEFHFFFVPTHFWFYYIEVLVFLFCDSPHWAKPADDTLIYKYFSQKIGLDISCRLYHVEMIYM